jgi:hypothetical protein
MKRLILITAILISATGCVDIGIKTRLNADGSGVQIWSFSGSALIAGEIKKQIETDPLLKKGKRIADQYKNGEYSSGVEIVFENVSELEDEGRKIQFEKKGWIRQTCTYTETWDDQKGRIPSIMKGAGGIVPLRISVTVEMPGEITKTNSSQSQDNTAVWNFSIAEIAGPRTLVVESVRWNISLILILAFSAAVMLTFAAYLVVRAPRRKVHGRICGSCGASVSDGAYCSACGSKLGTP